MVTIAMTSNVEKPPFSKILLIEKIGQLIIFIISYLQYFYRKSTLNGENSLGPRENCNNKNILNTLSNSQKPAIIVGRDRIKKREKGCEGYANK
ncbi:MAG: hypothetical protein ACOX23_07360 [Peptococcia bacterium]|jgi:hypothetical protein